MASPATGSTVYWCHLCNSETQPSAGTEGLVCSFCNQGFIEELDSTEIEPGVAFSTLPLPFGNLLRMPSPASVGITDRSTSDTPSPQQQMLPFPSHPSSSSSVTPSSTTQSQMQRTSSGQQRSDLQGHRPRILSGQLSGVPTLLEALMQIIGEMNGPTAEEANSLEGGDASHSDDHGAYGPSPPQRQHEPQNANEDPNHRPVSESQTQSASEDGEHTITLPPVPPLLIIHGNGPDGVRMLEIFVDHGQGMGPQMMPNHFRNYFMGSDLDRLIQTLSENDPNRYGTPPAAKSEVEKLPKFKITEEHLGSSSGVCAVCKDEFELEAEVLQMPCKHMYHPDCILPWLAEHNSCPVCRIELPTDDADYEARKRQQTAPTQTSANPDTDAPTRPDPSEEQGGRAPNTGNADEFPGLGPFTLWGMPSTGGLNQYARTGGQPDSETHDADGTQGQDASRRDRGPVHWLFRLFSSGSMSGRDSENDDMESRENGNGRTPSSP